MLPPLRHIAPRLSGRAPAALKFLNSHCGLLVCGLFLLAGWFLAENYGGDYGSSGVDNKYQVQLAQANLDYILGRADTIDTHPYHDRVYSAVSELPLLLAQRYLGEGDYPAAPQSVRFFLTHLFFVLAAYFGYRLACRLFNNRLLALAVLLIFLLHPRIYNHSYINSKDLPFLSMLMIALYLLERAFRKDTLGAFILLGIGVGLLTNLRIMGVMLFAATLGMRALDLFYAGNWRQRRGILLSVGLFLLAGGLTMYALSPFAWTDPIGYLLINLALTVEHSTVIAQLFQGELVASDELPPQYTVVWFGITTPPLFLLLGGLGAVVVAVAGLRRPGAVFRNTRLRFALLLLACFLLPPLAATVLGSVQLDHWRHLYFIYTPFCLLAGGGLHWLCSIRPGRRFRAGAYGGRRPERALPYYPKLFRGGAYGLAGAGLGLIILQMMQIHPWQDIYFNFLVDRTTPEYLRTRYAMYSLSVKTLPALEFLQERHPGETLAVRGWYPGRQNDGGDQDADYALFYLWDDTHLDLAFNALPVGRIYNNTMVAMKPLKDSLMTPSAIADYREFYRQAVAGEPIIRADYDVYLNDRTLTFIRENCQWDDRRRQVYAKVLLPDLKVATGSAIWFRSHGVLLEDTCLAVIQLPQYARGDLIIGQDTVDEHRWAELYSFAQPGLPERIAMARRKNRQPALREVFDVFLEQEADGRQRLLYAKPDCTPGDHGTVIYLHIYPVDTDDLPPYTDVRNTGKAIRDFYLYEFGGWPGDECIAVVPLPDYPGGIREIRTGQPEHRWGGSLYPPADPAPLRRAYAALALTPPQHQGDFAVYWRDGQLTYIRESCTAADTAAMFFLHIFPANADLLTEPAADIDYLDFGFGRWGGLFDGKCLAAVPLPDYPIAGLRTGQYVPDQGNLWSVDLIAPADPGPLRAAYAALADGELLDRNYFDLYELDNRLVYARETCALADTAAPFYLYVVPEDIADLPAEQRADGQAWLRLDFPRHGGHFDGKCLAVVPLPDYPLKEIRTGQYIPNQGDLWRAELVAPADPAELRADYAALSAANPAIRDYFDLYAVDNRLIYLRETCAAADTAAPFFLHIFPQDVADLPAERQSDGSVWSDFNFIRQGGSFDGKCLASVTLPDYPIKEIHTGQHIPGQGPLWLAELIAAADPDKLRATYAALSVEKPAARNYFDLYRQDNQLIYLRENCAAGDTAAPFFLHIFPEDVADLPAERRATGSVWSDFNFIRQGGRFDGKCLATVSLPDYPIKEIQTGQHIPGRGPLWLAELITAADPDKLRETYAALSATKPVVRDYFDLYLMDNRLVYVRETCAAADTAVPFFLPIVPERTADLPAARRDAFFAHWGFNFVHGGFDFARHGGHFDGKCLATVPLPDYPIAALRTGQHIPGQGDLWSVALAAAADPDELRAEYAALSAEEPAARDYFDLYLMDNRLLYVRENCAAADMAAEFFLYVSPEDLTALPAEWRADGYAYLGFNFVRWGGRFDGKCLAAVPLPDYPIKEMRTGQHIPGQGDLWSAELALER